MVEINFKQGDFGYEGVTIKNHAGDSRVCAAVSALGMTLVGALHNIQILTYNKLECSSGNIDLEINPMLDDEIQSTIDTIFKTIYIGLKQLEATYPNDLQVIKNVI